MFFFSPLSFHAAVKSILSSLFEGLWVFWELHTSSQTTIKIQKYSWHPGNFVSCTALWDLLQAGFNGEQKHCHRVNLSGMSPVSFIRNHQHLGPWDNDIRLLIGSSEDPVTESLDLGANDLFLVSQKLSTRTNKIPQPRQVPGRWKLH